MLVTSKSMQRRLAYDARNAQQDKARLSQFITKTVLQLTDYQQAETVLWYLHCRSEVQTYQMVMDELLSQGKKIVIPYCTKDSLDNNHLGLWYLQNLSELVEGTWGILEPPKARWGEAGKEVNPLQIDCVVVPGVAFDMHGGRLGHGAGYYDRLFTSLKPSCKLFGVCFNCQLVEQVCMQKYDIYMDKVITETGTYEGKGR